MVSRSPRKAVEPIMPAGDRFLCVKCHHFTAVSQTFESPGVYFICYVLDVAFYLQELHFD